MPLLCNGNNAKDESEYKNLRKGYGTIYTQKRGNDMLIAFYIVFTILGAGVIWSEFGMLQGVISLILLPLGICFLTIVEQRFSYKAVLLIALPILAISLRDFIKEEEI